MKEILNPEYGRRHIKFQFYVAWVDQNSTVRDEQQTPTLNKISPQTGRNLHIGGFRVNGQGGGISLNVLVPQEVLGSFKMPQVGDVVWIEEDYRYSGATATYLYSAYNNVPEGKKYGSNPVPQWGSMAGDYGHLRTHRDHNRQFTSSSGANFVRKYVRSITGYRFRKFYNSNLKEGKFVVRGDPVFDINPTLDDSEYVIEDGVDIGYGSTLTKTEPKDYPNPLNVPSEREENPDYTYIDYVYEPIDFELGLDPYKFDTKSKKKLPKKVKHVLKNRNYMSYQPVMDKTYLNDVDFEREIPAAEEYQVALRGNNKLLIQDQSGDGEQLLITLKSQYDEGFTIIHNGERGQVRVRDHLGQGVLLEANPEHPRVVSWTSARQMMTQGHIPDVGAYTYIRNGDIYGDSDTSFGTKTGVQKDEVSNQEFLLTSTPEIATEIGDTLSGGMRGLAASAAAAGIFMRNNIDPESSDQTYAIYNTGDRLVHEVKQAYLGEDGKVENTLRRHELTGTSVTDTYELIHDATGTPTQITETKIAADGTVSREYELNFDNIEFIRENESIVGPNTALKTSSMILDNANEINITQDGLVATTTLETVVGGDTQNVVTLGASGLVTSRYVGGAEFSRLNQTDTDINIERTPEGAALNINVGADGGTGTITIGHATADVDILGESVNVEGTVTQIGNGGTNNIIGITDFTET